MRVAATTKNRRSTSNRTVAENQPLAGQYVQRRQRYVNVGKGNYVNRAGSVVTQTAREIVDPPNGVSATTARSKPRGQSKQ